MILCQDICVCVCVVSLPLNITYDTIGRKCYVKNAAISKIYITLT